MGIEKENHKKKMLFHYLCSCSSCAQGTHGRARARQKRQGRAREERKRKKEMGRSKEKGTKQDGIEKKKQKSQVRKEKALQGQDRN